MSKTFYRLYRPQKFDELVGQELIRLTLKQTIKESRIAHAYLFTGPRGTGKTTTARIFAKAVNCLTPLDKRSEAEPCDNCKNCQAIIANKTLDLMEIDAASYTGVDNIRQLTENIDLLPVELRYRVFIIDEIHMLSRGAFNALLKTLEEPPPHTIFILATTEQHKVPATITSRCQRFSFRLLTLPEILKKLSKIAKEENIDIDKDSLEMISEAAHGGMRDAESLFAQVATLAGKKIKSNETKEILGIAGRDEEINLLNQLFGKEIDKTIDSLEQMNREGADIFLLSHRLLDYLRKIVFIKLNPKGADIIKNEISESQVEELKKMAKKVTVNELLSITSKIVHSQPAIKSSSFPHLPLELAIVDWGIDGITDSQLPISNENPKNSDTNIKSSSISQEEETVSSPLKRESARTTPRQDESSFGLEPDGVPESKPALSAVEGRAEESNNEAIKQSSNKTKKNKKTIKNEEQINIESTSADFKTVLDKWTTVLQSIREIQPALFSLLKVCSPVKIEDEALVISTPFKFHKDKLSDGKNRTMFCQELNKIVGIKRICVVQDDALAKNKVDDDEMLDQVKSLLAG